MPFPWADFFTKRMYWNKQADIHTDNYNCPQFTVPQLPCNEAECLWSHLGDVKQAPQQGEGTTKTNQIPVYTCN